MGIAIRSHEEVVRLDISVDDLPLVQVFDAFDHLVADHERTLHRHDLVALDEDILDAGAQQVHQHHVVLSLRGHSVHLGYAHNVGGGVQVLIHFSFEVELRELGGCFLQFGCILFIRVVLILRQVDLPEGSGAQLPHQSEIVANDQV